MSSKPLHPKDVGPFENRSKQGAMVEEEKTTLSSEDTATGTSTKSNKGFPFDAVLSVDGVAFLIQDYLLKKADPVTFGSLKARLSFALSSKAFNRSLQARVKKAKAHCFYSMKPARWDLVKLPANVTLCKTTPPRQGWMDALSDVEKLELKFSPLRMGDLVMLLEAAPNLKSLTLNQCTLSLTLDEDKFAELGVPVSPTSLKAIEFIRQVIAPAEGLAAFVVDYPTFEWESPQSGSKRPLRPLLRPRIPNSYLEMTLDSRDELGSILHWYTHFQQTRKRADVWGRIKLTYLHETPTEYLFHHRLSNVPIYLSPRFFVETKLARPSSQDRDMHSVLWEGLLNRPNCAEYHLFDIIAQTGGYVWQRFYKDKSYKATVSNQATVEAINTAMYRLRVAQPGQVLDLD